MCEIGEPVDWQLYCESHLTALSSYVMLIDGVDWIMEMAVYKLNILSI